MAVNQSLVASVRLRRILSSPCNTYRINLLQISYQPNIGLLPFFNPSNYKVLIYIEHRSVCPLVGIGTPPPL